MLASFLQLQYVQTVFLNFLLIKRPPEQPKQTGANRRRNHSLSDWMSDEIQEELWLIVEALNKKRQFQLQSGAGGRSREARLENPPHLQRPKFLGPQSPLLLAGKSFLSA